MRLIVFCGLPGVGKTTLAKQLAKDMSATYLRIDSIEQAVLRSAVNVFDIEDAGYLAAYALATDNLNAGNSVIVDAVNPLNVIRAKWAAIATLSGATIEFIEIICSDPEEHRARAEARQSDIEGHTLPSWDEIVNLDYEELECEALTIDTATATFSESVDALKQLFQNA